MDKQGRVQIQINLIELLAQRMNTFSEEETKKIELINKKVVIGFKDMDYLIKDTVVHNRKLNITIIIGRPGIIDTDMQKAMGEARPLTAWKNCSSVSVALLIIYQAIFRLLR